ncbi:MAG: N-acetylmuramoyl-L-alanine amidase [Spirochaetales bacterium]|nr:N-acetylmuramoyl-L-alanine amidase [Spirochaetales bacterium]
MSTFIIDAGHGGKDPGAQGFGINEKDINLEIAKEIGSRLEKSGRNVLLTRYDDYFLSLAERCDIANSSTVYSSGYPLFVSIHVNASEDESASGFEVYIKDESKLVNMISRSMNQLLAIKYSSYKPSELNRFKDDLSMAVAESIIQNVKKNLPETRIRGVKRGDLYVLNSTWMPSVLIELGFISNRKENGYLKDERYKDLMVDAIVKALESF